MGAQSLVIFIFVQLFVLAIGLERISEKSKYNSDHLINIERNASSYKIILQNAWNIEAGLALILTAKLN